MARITEALALARRHHRAARAQQIAVVLRGGQLAQPAVVAAAYTATVWAQAAILTVLNTQIAAMEEQVTAHFGEHRTSRCIRASPVLG